MLFKAIKVKILEEYLLHHSLIIHLSQDKKIAQKMLMFIGHKREEFLQIQEKLPWLVELMIPSWENYLSEGMLSNCLVPVTLSFNSARYVSVWEPRTTWAEGMKEEERVGIKQQPSFGQVSWFLNTTGFTLMAAMAAAQLPMRELEAGVTGDITGFKEMIPNNRDLLGAKAPLAVSENPEEET